MDQPEVTARLRGLASPHHPSLDGIEVVVPPERPATEQEVRAKLRWLARERGQRRRRKRGEPVRRGDELCLTCVAFAHGRVLPFSPLAERVTPLEPESLWPGLCERLVGAGVGGSWEFEVNLPPDYALPALRGAKATFQVDLLAATQVTPLDVKRLEVLRALAPSLARELERDRGRARRNLARQLVLEELVRRYRIQISDRMVNQEIRERWREAEGRLLTDKRVPPSLANEALLAWLADPTTRASCRRGLEISHALLAVAERAELQLSPDAMAEAAVEMARPMGLRPSGVADAIRQSRHSAKRVATAALHLLAMRHVMGKARVRFSNAKAA